MAAPTIEKGQQQPDARSQAQGEMAGMQSKDLKDAMFFIECLADDARRGRTQANRKSRGKDKLGANGRLEKNSASAGEKQTSANASASGAEASATSSGGVSAAASTTSNGGAGGGGGAGAAIGRAERSLNDWFNPKDSDPAKGLSQLI